MKQQFFNNGMIKTTFSDGTSYISNHRMEEAIDKQILKDLGITKYKLWKQKNKKV
jgi:GTP cyclohydrolase II